MIFVICLNSYELFHMVLSHMGMLLFVHHIMFLPLCVRIFLYFFGIFYMHTEKTTCLLAGVVWDPGEMSSYLQQLWVIAASNGGNWWQSTEAFWCDVTTILTNAKGYSMTRQYWVICSMFCLNCWWLPVAGILVGNAFIRPLLYTSNGISLTNTCLRWLLAVAKHHQVMLCVAWNCWLSQSNITTP